MQIGPNLQTLPKFGGPNDELEWTFSDGISDFSNVNDQRSRKHRDGQPLSKNRSTNKKNKSKKKTVTKKSKKRNHRSSRRGDTKLDFYKKHKSIASSTIPADASDVNTPKFRNKNKSKGKLKNKSISPSGSIKNRYESSEFNEGGSRVTISNNMASQPDQFWAPSPSSVGKMNYMQSKHRNTSNKQRDNHEGRGRICLKSIQSPPNRSSSQNDGFRECVISPRVQDKDYIAELQDNSAFERRYNNEVSFGNLHDKKSRKGRHRSQNNK